MPKKKNGNGLGSKLKWAAGGILIGVLGAIGYDLYKRGKEVIKGNDGDAAPNPASPYGLPGNPPGGHTTTIIGMPLPQLAPATPAFANPSQWGPRNEDDLELYREAERIAERRQKKREEKLARLIKEFEED